jgi:hypothetical protein
MPQPGVLTAGQPTEEQFCAAGGARCQEGRLLAGADREGHRLGRGQGRGTRGAVRAVAGHRRGRPDAGAAERLAAELGSADGTAMVCCGSSNRVGALLALKAFWVDKKPKAQALELGKQAGLKAMLPAVEAKLK